MKTLYLIYVILIKKVSIIRITRENKSYIWAAHDKSQDGYGAHSGNWAEGSTAQKAVWNLRKNQMKKNENKTKHKIL